MYSRSWSSRLFVLLLLLSLSLSPLKVLATSPYDITLPLGEINVVVVTDVHSWVGGHGFHEPNSTADYGTVISFVERLRERVAATSINNTTNHDVWFVMNGDWIDGTGLAMNGDPSKLIPILERMPYDAMNVGNHELYKNSVISKASETAGLIESFGHRYLSSNVVHNNSVDASPLGYTHRILSGKNARVLTMGFLFNMTNADDLVTVRPVEDVLHDDWFIQAVSDTDSYDAILILAHMDVRDPLCELLFQRIRQLAGSTMPIQFITGHTHRRDYHVWDEYSTSFEAGRYLDTVGFVSFPTKTTILENRKRQRKTVEELNQTSFAPINSTSATANPLFQHVFMDADPRALAQALGISTTELQTERGNEQSEFIHRIQKEMGLLEVIGCSKQHYLLNRSLYDSDSLWGYFQNIVVPHRFASPAVDSNVAILFGNGGWRYELYPGDVRLDDAIGVSPFNNSLYVWKKIPIPFILELNRTLTIHPDDVYPYLPEFVLAFSKPLDPKKQNYDQYNNINEVAHLVVDEFEADFVEEMLLQVINGTNYSLPSRALYENATTTSIWIDFFLENSHTCKQAKQLQPPHSSNPFWQSSPKTTKETPTGDDDWVATNANTVLIAVGTAVAITFVLGSMAVWQKGIRFHRLVTAREIATLQARREYEGFEDVDEHIMNYEDYPSNNTEGEFV